MSILEPKQKKCECAGCENTFRQFNSLQKYCSKKCQKKAKDGKEPKKQMKEIEGLKKAYDIRSVSLTELQQKAKREVQAFVRFRDVDKPCISCDTTNPKEWHGGHLFKSEIYSGVEMSENNIFKQCGFCNTVLDGNFEGFKVGVIKRYGVEFFESLQEVANETRRKKWSREELESIISEYRQRNNEIRKGVLWNR